MGLRVLIVPRVRVRVRIRVRIRISCGHNAVHVGIYCQYFERKLGTDKILINFIFSNVHVGLDHDVIGLTFHSVLLVALAVLLVPIDELGVGHW